MIDVEVAFTASFFSLAYCAFSTLRSQHPIVFAGLQPIVGLSPVVSKTFWVGIATALLIFGHFFKVLEAPLIVARVLTRFAVDLVAMQSGFRSMKARQGFGSFAFRTGFESGRQIELVASSHRCSLSRLNNTLYNTFNTLSTLHRGGNAPTQGAF